MTQSAAKRRAVAQRAAFDRVERTERALARILWRSVADDDTCSCYPNDVCDLCEAMAALGGPRWTTAAEAEKFLAAAFPGSPRRDAEPVDDHAWIGPLDGCDCRECRKKRLVKCPPGQSLL